VVAANAANLNDLAQTAQRAMAAGRMDEAARAWEAVLTIEPNHAQGLFFFGRRSLARGDATTAREQFRRAAASAPREPMIRVNLAFADRALGDATAEMQALDEALAIDPYCYPALLYKAAAVERAGSRRQAARLYKNALTILPDDSMLPPEMRMLAQRGRDAVRENAEEFDAFLRDRLGGARERHRDAHLDRFEECKDVMVGTKKLYRSEPVMLHFPRIPSVAFYDTAEFSWLKDVEAQTGAIGQELQALLATREREFKPYVHHPEGVPLNQWAELNNSMKWNSLFLWEDGKRNEDHCRACPRTAAVTEAAPLCVIPGYAPAVFFSALQPGAHIPAHTGVTNTRLIVHLPLIVPEPEKCWFRVGNDKREWKEGQAWVFDDTMEHEAWNDSGGLRVILIFDIWNPNLSAAEREMVSALLLGFRDYYGGAGGGVDWH
jgi:aspartyl/asparaginyl beta-hydroxylase (cupin superfamily)